MPAACSRSVATVVSVIGALAVHGSGRIAAAELPLSDLPLLVETSVPPNLMLMLDSSGAMQNPTLPPSYDATAAQPECPAENRLDPGLQVELYVEIGGGPRIAQSFAILPEQSGSPEALVDSVFPPGVGSGQRCFDNSGSAYYSARLNAEPGVATDIIDGLGYRIPADYPPARYSGHFLNWYFNADNTAAPWNAGQLRKPVSDAELAMTRAEQARAAANNLVESLDARFRVGLSSFNGATGGRLDVAVAPLTSAHRSALQEEIDAVVFSGSAPLAEALAGIGRYFTQGHAATGPLDLHPGEAGAFEASVSSVLPATLSGAGGSPTAPIALACQHSYAALLTAGRPDEDRDISEALRDYDGDCSGSEAGNCVAEVPNHDRKVDRQYTPTGSDYLDDVAQALFEIDLRPDFPPDANTDVQFINNLVTHVVGFADDEPGSMRLMIDTASQGGGRYFPALDATGLDGALSSIASASVQGGGLSAVSLNSTALTTETRVFQASFRSSDWSGNLVAFPISTGPTGGACPGTPVGQLCPAAWSAAERLDARVPASRTILTLRPATHTGVPFRWSSLETSQRSLLNLDFRSTTSSSVVDERGEQRLDFLRGDRSQEGTGGFRVRGSLLGDIVNSDPVFVGAPNQGHAFPGYAAFRSAQGNRTPMVYVGANDGMLHGFRADDGEELIAYVPNALFGRTAEPKLAKLSANPYVHTWGVDGSIAVGDVQVGSTGAAGDWRSVLIGTLGYGGQGLFALDVTDPTSFSEANAAQLVKWEFTDSNSGPEGRDLGRTFSQPFVVKMKNGRWAAVVGNGYNNTESDGQASSSGAASLLILFVDGPGADGIWAAGSEYIRLQVPGGSVDSPNGLSSAAPVDLDGDGLIDYIYAGDLLGNLWQFNVNSADAAQWTVAYGDQPLFVARDHAGVRQPITAGPEVGLNLLSSNDPDDLIVYFGTGRFVAAGDNQAAGQQNQSFYGIFANPVASPPGAPLVETATISPAIQRSDLLEQSILEERSVNGDPVRISSQLDLDLAIHRGWFLDLYMASSGVDDAAAADGANRGERSITRPLLRNGRIVFTTLLPSSDPCSIGGDGFLMELDAQTGSRPRTPVLDITGDFTVDQEDLLDLDFEPSAGLPRVPPSGVGAPGVLSRPSILTVQPGLELKLMGSSAGEIEIRAEAGPSRTGRLTWREIHP